MLRLTEAIERVTQELDRVELLPTSHARSEALAELRETLNQYQQLETEGVTEL